MLKDITSIGDKIDIKQLDQQGRVIRTAKSYVSQLLDYVDLDVINIAMPIDSGKLILLEVGEGYNLCFYTLKGLYQCKCKVINRTKDNNTFIAVVQLTSELDKIQRRQFYRMECILEMEYRSVIPEEVILEEKLKNNDGNPLVKEEVTKALDLINKDWIKASITDLSGGGARYTSETMHQRGDKVILMLELNVSGINKKFPVGSEIISSSRIMNRYGFYEHRVEFYDIGKKEREHIIKFVFEQERQKRKKS